jgi:hypothetical protein
MDLIEKKQYPDEYPAEAVRVLNTMTFPGSELLILGSASLRSQTYAGDYDGYDKVNGKLPNLIGGFKNIIKNLKKLPDAYITDIKAGEVGDWKVVPDSAKEWNLRKAQEKVEGLLREGIISEKEAKDADLSSYLMAKKDVKFHVVRWTPEEVIKGSKKLRDGRTYTLEEAFTSPAIVKVDVIAIVKNIYRDFSVIYELSDGDKRLNDFQQEPASSIQEDIRYYTLTNNPYKALKRKFALAKLHNDVPAMKRHSKIINSELGKLYLIYSEIKTLADLLEAGNDISGIQQLLTHIDIPAEMRGDIAKVKTKADYPILRHIEAEVLKELSKGTKLRGGIAYSPYKG